MAPPILTSPEDSRFRALSCCHARVFSTARLLSPMSDTWFCASRLVSCAADNSVSLDPSGVIRRVSLTRTREPLSSSMPVSLPAPAWVDAFID